MSISCYNCKDRFVNDDTGERCHTKCEKYIDYRVNIESKRRFLDNHNKLDKYHEDAMRKKKRRQYK